MEPIKRAASLKDSVADTIRMSIVTGELALGQPLSERTLAERLNVSKTPVREALAQLRLEGLVHAYPQRGAFVFTPNRTEVVEMCELRQALEAAALKMAIERHPDDAKRALETIVHRMEAALGHEDRRAYLAEDTQFHQALFMTCGNGLLMRTYEMHVGKISALRTHLAQRQGHTALSFAEHKSILQAVKDRDSEHALAILDTHIARTRLSYSAEVERSNDAQSNDSDDSKSAG
ncbi:GntR family transcriptional regulator [Pararobbsia silviterrae]|nr:GntR family transcriptional regulator [Pararobbsia silviterrae]